MKALTLTIAANMTSNYDETLGNITSIHKIYRNGREYAIRSRESIKNAICVQSGLYDDLITYKNNKKEKFATQKEVTNEINAATCRALEGGYMSTKDVTYIRNSSFYITDAISCEIFVNDSRFHNNLYLATNYANSNGLNVQNDADKVGLMPYQYEYDKSLKLYSITIDLESIGVDKNFNAEADNAEKCARVLAIVNAVENLSLVVKGSLDNAEPVFVVGGLSNVKTHVFENAVAVSNKKLSIEPIKQKLNDNFSCGIMRNGQFTNEDDIVRELNAVSTAEFFAKIREQVEAYFAG